MRGPPSARPYVPTPHDKWDALTRHLNGLRGKPARAISARALQSGVLVGVGGANSTWESRTQLDVDWVLICYFYRGTLARADLVTQPPILAIKPPSHYTGIWRTYRANGDVETISYYLNGKWSGPLGDGVEGPVGKPQIIEVAPTSPPQ